jgi:diguanylate cyclase (GGDEF)-like protein/putative nucleotidyltransferase with HDIG domain
MSDAHGSLSAVKKTPQLHTLRSLLPQGGSLPLDEWRRRHAGILVLLSVNVVALPVYGVVGGRSSLPRALAGGLGLAVLTALGAAPRMSRKIRTACASLGLLIAAALLVHASGGLIESHFYFFVVIIVLTLYEDWMPFLMAVAFVLVHHGLLGTLEPRTVYDRPEEWAHPWKWAAIHAAYVAAAGVAALAAWRLNEGVRAKMREAQHQLEHASETDSLTGLSNRRKLMLDLEEVTSSRQPAVLVLLDLDGFKAYNDTFGHPAGDSLLTRLGARLRAAVGDAGRVYRLGGDEFCVIWSAGKDARARVEAISAAALTERGEGFAITAARGASVLPLDATNAEDALRTADLRMYSHKASSRASSSTQSRDVLLRMLAELRPELEPHVTAVAVLAEAVAVALGLSPHAIENVRYAAQLHDIGKIAIPDAILDKPGRLDEQEWGFIRRHTVVGERILNAAPALAEVAAIVRSSHEHYDGKGYPDSLAGTAIPLGSRIIAVCDAFDAMTANRTYRLAMSPADALAELERCSGTQFDPQIVDVFKSTLAQTQPSSDGARPQDDAAAPSAPRVEA